MNNKKIIIILSIVLTIILALTSLFFFTKKEDEFKLKKDKVHLEFADSFKFNIKDYVVCDEDLYDEIKIEMDESFKNMSDFLQIGEYEVNFSYKDKTETMTFIVEDTTAPIIHVSNDVDTLVLLKDSVNIRWLDFFYVEDYGALEYELIFNPVDISKVGDYEIIIIYKDLYNNETKKTLKVKVVDNNSTVPLTPYYNSTETPKPEEKICTSIFCNKDCPEGFIPPKTPDKIVYGTPAYMVGEYCCNCPTGYNVNEANVAFDEVNRLLSKAGYKTLKYNDDLQWMADKRAIEISKMVTHEGSFTKDGYNEIITQILGGGALAANGWKNTSEEWQLLIKPNTEVAIACYEIYGYSYYAMIIK